MKIIKVKRTIEITECKVKCEVCGKVIIGSTESQVMWNLAVHKQSKECSKIKEETKNELHK